MSTTLPPTPVKRRPASTAHSPTSQEILDEGVDARSLLIAVRMAWRGLGANRLRAFLTMLGVIIGVAAVIVAIGIGEGSRAAVAESIQRLGTNVLTVIPGAQRVGGVNLGSGSRTTLKMADAEAILKDCPSVGRISPEVNRSFQVKYENKNTNATVNGTGKDYPVISNHPLKTGRYISDSDIRSRARVAVLGSDAANDLFGTTSPIGKTIRVGTQSFQVVGLLKQKGGTGFQNPDSAVFIPNSTAMRRLLGIDYVQRIVCQARTFTLMSRAQKEIDALLRKQHKISSDGQPDFTIFNQADLAEAQDAQQGTFASLITYLAVVSLFVGGIGIMNIMLVSVTERTREIGVRKAIGARRADILLQFLLESLFLSLVGGLMGVAFGFLGSTLIGKANNWRVVIQPTTVALAFSFSAVVGVFFGFYPALKASRLRPIEALRYE
jgi:putative ABC transport system permease protein